MSSAPSQRVNIGTQKLRLAHVPVQADENGAKPFDKMLVSGQCTGDMYPVVYKTNIEKHYTKTIGSLFDTIVREDLPENKILVDMLQTDGRKSILKYVKYNQLSSLFE